MTDLPRAEAVDLPGRWLAALEASRATVTEQYVPEGEENPSATGERHPGDVR
ncbi:hypothetical protein AB0J21_11895 [Streptomyces sp. NPDC049954]|uniref:hypothetical protein n=1 Tax=Streptomyces sp. NPDC049954 TaxID=3155779 RepID=UPI003440297F